MHWASSLSTSAVTEAAVDEAVEATSTQLGSAPDLVFVFASRHHRTALADLPARIQGGLGQAPLIGCTAGGVIGAQREIESAPGLAIVAAHLPGVQVAPFMFQPQGVPPPGTATASWDARLGLRDGSAPSFIVIPDPFTCRVGDFIRAIEGAYPESSVVGGMASGGTKPGDSALFFGDEMHAGGVVGVALSGNISVDTVVAQGCRPIGSPMFVTRGNGNLIQELDGRSPSAVLKELYAGLPASDQQRMRSALHMGVAMRPAEEIYNHGDFLIRNIIALDGNTGSLAVAAEIDKSSVVQFHVRDKQASADDLDKLMAAHCSDNEPPAGALLFSCLGRGQGLYGEADHDTGAFIQHAGPVPIGGFFCNGEIGPVGGRTHLHGYTSAFALFRRQRAH